MSAPPREPVPPREPPRVEGSYLFVRRPIVAIVLSIVTVLVGAIAMRSLPIAWLPSVVPPQIVLSTAYTGADALTLEQSVATPIEQQLNGVDNMLYMQSTNANDGTMALTVTFDVGTNIDTDNVLTQNRLDQAQPQLPADVRTYGVTVLKSTGLPLLVFSLYSPRGTYSGEFLGNYGIININDALLRVRGVGQIRNFGTSSYAMRVWVKPDQLTRLGLTVSDLLDAIQKQNVVNPAGQLGGEPSPPGQEFTYSMRAQGRLVDADEFGRIVVRSDPSGAQVKLADVARIDLGTEIYGQRGRFEGQPAAVIGVFQTPGSNALQVADGLKQAMAQLAQRFPGDLEYRISLDTTLPIAEGISEIVQTLFLATLLVIGVVFLFLQTWRATLIPLLTVPVSLIGAFALFPLLGFSINTLSLFGLVLAIGLVVDDAIVVVEAVERHIEEGLSPRDATVLAMQEVAGPVIAIALILSSVFIPMAFVPGITGRLYQQFALTIAISVLISALNALTLSPALCSLILRPAASRRRGALGRFFGLFNRGFERSTERSVAWTRRFAGKAGGALAALAVAALLSAWLGSRLPTGFVPEEDQGYFFVNVQLPDSASLQRTDSVCREIEQILAHTAGVRGYNTIAGFSILTQTVAPYQAFFFVQLLPSKQRSQGVAAILASLNRELAALPEAVAVAFGPPAIPGIGRSGGFDVMVQDRSGGSPEFLAGQVDRFVQALQQRGELAGVTSPFRAQVPQRFVDVDRDKALKLGVDVQSVYQTLGAFMGGTFVNYFNRFGRQWRVYLQAEPEYRSEPEDIALYHVRNDRAQMVPLSTLAHVRNIAGPQFTQRFNLYRAAEVIGGAAPGHSSGEAMSIVQEVARQVLPPEIATSWVNLSYQEASAGSALPVFALSLLVVFLILAALYESWSLPWSVLLATPLAVLGAVLGLWLRSFELNVYGQVGLTMLIGLSAKNAILIVEFAKYELDRGSSPEEAALRGMRVRLRPILMTAFAFILGCVPLWFARGAGAIARQQLGTVVITGMATATLLGIFAVPMLFAFVERWIQRRAGRAHTSVGRAE